MLNLIEQWQRNRKRKADIKFVQEAEQYVRQHCMPKVLAAYEQYRQEAWAMDSTALSIIGWLAVQADKRLEAP